MARRDPPTITAVTLEPTTVNQGDTVTAQVTWTGYAPGAVINFQWRIGSSVIPGETAAAHVLTADVEGINCIVQIDNGRGTATAASVSATIGTDVDAFTSGFSRGFD